MCVSASSGENTIPSHIKSSHTVIILLGAAFPYSTAATTTATTTSPIYNQELSHNVSYIPWWISAAQLGTVHAIGDVHIYNQTYPLIYRFQDPNKPFSCIYYMVDHNCPIVSCAWYRDVCRPHLQCIHLLGTAFPYTPSPPVVQCARSG
jgi:hypothetical protein